MNDILVLVLRIFLSDSGFFTCQFTLCFRSKALIAKKKFLGYSYRQSVESNRSNNLSVPILNIVELSVFIIASLITNLVFCSAIIFSSIVLPVMSRYTFTVCNYLNIYIDMHVCKYVCAKRD